MAYTRLGSVLTQAIVNDLLSALEVQNTFQHGRGIISGLAISAGSGLTLNIASGKIVGLSPTSLSSTTFLCTASSTQYIWINEAGTVLATPTTADPGGTYVCLGKVVSGGSSISSVAADGRTELPRMTDVRTWQAGQIKTDVSAGTIGFFGATPVAKTSVSDPAAFGNADAEIGGLTIGVSYSQSEVQALRDKCEELADDCRALRATVLALTDALQALGLV